MDASEIMKVKEELITLEKELDSAVPFDWITSGKAEDHASRLVTINREIFESQVWRINDVRDMAERVSQKFRSNMKYGCNSLCSNSKRVAPEPFI